MKKIVIVSLVAVMVGLFAVSAFAQNPCIGDCKQGWNSADPRQPAPGQVSLRAQTYNNTTPGGDQVWPGVDAVEIRQNLKKNGSQLWFSKDRRWDKQDGKFSLLFPSKKALSEYCAKSVPSPAELRAKAAAEPLCPSSVGKGQRWKSF